MEDLFALLQESISQGASPYNKLGSPCCYACGPSSCHPRHCLKNVQFKIWWWWGGGIHSDAYGLWLPQRWNLSACVHLLQDCQPSSSHIQNALGRNIQNWSLMRRLESVPKLGCGRSSKVLETAQDVILVSQHTPLPHLASFTGSFSDADDDQPGIPVGQLVPSELGHPLSWQLPPLQQSPSYLNRWAGHHPQILDGHELNGIYGSLLLSGSVPVSVP